jgi:PTH1 family peptidyl-tRNA hydrolase
MTERLLLVGLGNPGTAYAANRHNVGFMAVDAIVRRHGFGAYRNRFRSHAADGRLLGREVLILKPMTFMNESGQAVAAAARFYKIPPGEIFVFHDDIDLAAGRLRVKQGGGHAGHNGLRSIDAHIGADFWRVRLGVGRPQGVVDVVRHVLADFSKADALWLDPLLDAVAAHVGLLISGDAAGFMNKVAVTLKPALPKPPRPVDTAAPAGSTEGSADGI